MASLFLSLARADVEAKRLIIQTQAQQVEMLPCRLLIDLLRSQLTLEPSLSHKAFQNGVLFCSLLLRPGPCEELG